MGRGQFEINTPEGVQNCLRAQPEGNSGHPKAILDTRRGIYFKESECHTLRTQLGFNPFLCSSKDYALIPLKIIAILVSQTLNCS